MRAMKKIMRVTDGKAGQMVRKAQIAVASTVTFFGTKMVTNASIGKNIQNAVTEQVQGIAIAILCVILLPLLARRNWIAVGITAVFGIMTVILIGNPTVLQAIGNELMSKVLGI